MLPFSTERLQIFAPCQASLVRATWRGSGERKSADVRHKMATLIYPYPCEAQTKNSNNTNPEAFACVSSIFYLKLVQFE
jgi:hypothetical protein